MNISVNCPSYKRPKVKTLDYLPFVRVWVDESEYDDYCRENNPDNIVSVPKGIQGNVARIRNYILDQEFQHGADIVVLVDDDLRKISHYEIDGTNAYNKVKLEPNEFMDFIEHYSVLCNDFGFKFWGVNINFDAMGYRHATPFSTLQFIGGPFQCFLNNPLRYDEDLPLKEDYDMCLQHLAKYRGVLRVNKYNYTCDQSTIRGGCAAMRNYIREEEQLNRLIKKWGSQIVKKDHMTNANTKKVKKNIDYNPVIHVPIKGI